ncbi:unnamed protein product, partial [marine sediment metagenome]
FLQQSQQLLQRILNIKDRALGTLYLEQCEQALKLLQQSEIEQKRQGKTLMQQVADKGYFLAQYHYGYLLKEGFFDDKDEALAREYLEKASVHHIAACIDYGFMLLNGVGGPEDKAKGKSYIALAAQRGSSKAMHYYALILFEERNIEESIKWMKKSADCGLTLSCYSYGKMLAEEMGEGGNISEAEYYLHLSTFDQALVTNATTLLQRIHRLKCAFDEFKSVAKQDSFNAPHYQQFVIEEKLPEDRALL